MANRHSMMWRAPGRRDQEREKFAALMREIEAFRVGEGWIKCTLAAELETSKDALHNWLSARAIGRKETVEKLEAFLKSRGTARASEIAPL